MAERKKFLLRMDPKLWAEVESWAQQELRSVNSQIEFILRDAIRQRRRSKDNEPQVEDQDEYRGES